MLKFKAKSKREGIRALTILTVIFLTLGALMVSVAVYTGNGDTFLSASVGLLISVLLFIDLLYQVLEIKF
jgi:membrane protein CcdC involved in cytochrome C biogenesis